MNLQIFIPLRGVNVLQLYLSVIFLTNGCRCDNLPSDLTTVDCHLDLSTSKNNATSFLFQCSIKLTFNQSEGSICCEQFDLQSLIVHINSQILNYYFVCISDVPIFSKVIFDYEQVKKSFLNIQPQRIKTNARDQSTYLYQLNVFPPTDGIRMSENICASVKYTFFSVIYPDVKISILWHNKEMRDDEPKLCWMAKRTKRKEDAIIVGWDSHAPLFFPCEIIFAGLVHINAKPNSSVVVPCIHSDPNKIYLWQNVTRLVVDNKTVTYHPFIGFTIAPSVIEAYNRFICTTAAELSNTTEMRKHGRKHLCQYFFVKQNDLQFSYDIARPSKNMLALRPPFITDFYTLPLGIGSFFEIVEIFDYQGMDLSFAFDYPTNTAATFNCMGFYHGFNKIRNCSSDSYSQHNKSSADSTVVEYVTPGLSIGETFRFRVFANFTSHKIHISYIQLHRKSLQITYDNTNDRIKCISKGSPILKETACQSILMCKELAKNLHSGTAEDISYGSVCEDILLTSNNLADHHCKSIQPSNKGILECAENEKQFVQELYFRGFNGKLYLGLSDKTPNSAILKVSVDYKGPILPIPMKFTFRCEAHSYYFENGLLWFWKFSNGTEQLIPQGNLTEINYEDIDATFNPVKITQINIEDTKIIRILCSAPKLSFDVNNVGLWQNVSMDIHSQYATRAEIVSVVMEKTIKIGEKDHGLKCEADGFPTPTIYWKRNGLEIEAPIIVNDKVYQKTLQFPMYNDSYAGEYTCYVENYKGNDKRIFSVKTEPESQVLKAVTIALPLLSIVVLTALCSATYIVYKRAKNARNKDMDEMEALLHGLQQTCNDTENLANDFEANGANPFAQEYDTTFELDKHSFQMDFNKLLGQGEFGAVFKGRITKLEDDVAFKTPSSSFSTLQLKALISELKILIYIGRHDNIVALLGAYTQELRNGILYICVELCGLGSLESYLRSNKGYFLQCPVLNYYYELNRNTLTEGLPILESKTNSIISLFKWSSEVASAMDFIGSRKVIHSDLAARNILLTVDFVAKVSDFGLSRRTFNSSEYTKKGQDPLAWRWLAIESLSSSIFSVKSDVWSYGIVLWEMFSLGEIPYPGSSPTEEFQTQLINGLRNSKPKYASEQIYQVMTHCWDVNPDRRPKFVSLRNCFQNTLASSVCDVDITNLNSSLDTEDMAQEESQYMRLLELE